MGGLRLAGFVWLSAAGAATAAETVVPPERPAAVSEALKEAGELSKKLDDESVATRFREVLQPVAGDLAVVPATVGQPDGQYHKLTLNRGAEGLDAFVFEAPAAEEGAGATQTYDMDWSFVLPAPAPQMVWYILPVEGTMAGFENFNRSKNKRSKDPDVPAENLTIRQELRGGKLRAGERYIVWFRFEDGQPHDVYVDVALRPHK